MPNSASIKKTKRIILAIIFSLMAFFIFTLSLMGSADGVTAVISGLIFLFIGCFIPSIICCAIALYFSLEFFLPNKFLHNSVIFLLFSFVIGLNHDLVYLFHLENYQPRDFRINVIKPIQNADKLPKSFELHQAPNSVNEVIPANPLSLFNNAGYVLCFCMFYRDFTEPDLDLIKKTALQFIGRGKTPSYYTIGPEMNAFVPLGNPQDQKVTQAPEAKIFKETPVSYIVTYNLQSINSSQDVKLTMNIQDQVGGLLELQATYPASILIEPVPITFKDRNLLHNALMLLAHNNFWNWIFTRYIHPKTPYELMIESKAHWEAE